MIIYNIISNKKICKYICITAVFLTWKRSFRFKPFSDLNCKKKSSSGVCLSDVNTSDPHHWRLPLSPKALGSRYISKLTSSSVSSLCKASLFHPDIVFFFSVLLSLCHRGHKLACCGYSGFAGFSHGLIEPEFLRGGWKEKVRSSLCSHRQPLRITSGGLSWV